MVTFTILTNYNFIMNKSTFILGVFLLSFLSIEAQDYLEMMNSNQYTVLEVQNAAQAYFENRDTGRGTGYKSFKRWEYDAIRMQDDNGLLKSPSFYYKELERYNSYQKQVYAIRTNEYDP